MPTARKSNPKIKLPAKWTTAEVRVNPKGKVQVRINPSKLGAGGRVAKNVVKVERNSTKRACVKNRKRPNTVKAKANRRKKR